MIRFAAAQVDRTPPAGSKSRSSASTPDERESGADLRRPRRDGGAGTGGRAPRALSRRPPRRLLDRRRDPGHGGERRWARRDRPVVRCDSRRAWPPRSTRPRARSAEIGRRLAAQLRAADLVHVLVFADGIGVNGSELVRGLEARPPAAGLDHRRAGRRRRALPARPWCAGESTRSLRGRRPRLLRRPPAGRLWLARRLGSVRTRAPHHAIAAATSSSSSTSRPALELYRLYLGEHAADLPATGLLFPLSLRSSEGDTGLVRTIVGIDEQRGQPDVRRRRARGSARPIDARQPRPADRRRRRSRERRRSQASEGRLPSSRLLISCVGRKMILNQRVEEEVEAVREVLGPAAGLTGFYSYGEIAPALAACPLRAAQPDDDHHGLRRGLSADRSTMHSLLERQLRRLLTPELRANPAVAESAGRGRRGLSPIGQRPRAARALARPLLPRAPPGQRGAAHLGTRCSRRGCSTAPWSSSARSSRLAQEMGERLRAQEALTREEAKFRLFIEKLPAVSYVAEPGNEGRWLFVSPQIEALLGYAQDEWLADPRALVHPPPSGRRAGGAARGAAVHPRARSVLARVPAPDPRGSRRLGARRCGLSPRR